MSIRESRPDAPADPGARWAAARAFVERCHSWSVDEIKRRETDGRPLADWQVYLRFTEHTLHELDAGTLDAWFEAPPA
ncbi:MAG: hypothetical protein EXR69_07305 [Myxococcales bacterium]|nr:hypothetical protein [Myxococcales bacterium]